jgi:hypothetical protein
MAKFKVYLQQYVEQIATVEIEAIDENDAISKAKDAADFATWEPGDDAYSVEAYGVANASGEMVWER